MHIVAAFQCWFRFGHTTSSEGVLTITASVGSSAVKGAVLNRLLRRRVVVMLGYHRPQSGKYCEIGILKARVSFLNGTANTLEDSDCSSQRPCAPQDQWGSGERAFVPSRRQTHCSLYTDWSAERRVCGHRDKTGHTKADSRRDRGALSRSCASQAFFTASPPRSITRCERVPAQKCFGARVKLLRKYS